MNLRLNELDFDLVERNHRGARLACVSVPPSRGGFREDRGSTEAGRCAGSSANERDPWDASNPFRRVPLITVRRMAH
jgi:hypothetical protein